MPRGPRVDAPGVAHHVVIRGIEKRGIFVDHRDREAFLDRLDRLVPELGFICFAWVLMSNHVHLVLRTGPAPLSRLMSRLGTSYAGYFNKRHDRVGHLFQNRFWSRPIEDDLDLLGVVLYVHRNPLRAGLIESTAELEALDWCGHRSIVGRCVPRVFESVDRTRALIADDPQQAIWRFRARIGDGGFDVPQAPSVDARMHAQRESGPGLQAARADTDRPTLDELIREECEAAGCFRELVATRQRVALEARARIACRAVREWGYSARAVARALGVSDSSVSRALERASLNG